MFFSCFVFCFVICFWFVCFIDYLCCVPSFRFNHFWLNIKWAPTDKYQVFGTSSRIIPLTYDNWDATALATFDPLYGVVYRFFMIVNTGQWHQDYLPHEYGVICEFGKLLYKYLCSQCIHNGLCVIQHSCNQLVNMVYFINYAGWVKKKYYNDNEGDR